MTNELRERLMKDYHDKIAEANKVLKEGTPAQFDAKVAELQAVEQEYKTNREKEVFAELVDLEDAFRMHHFSTIAHRKVFTEGTLTCLEETEKDVVIDLKRLSDYKQLPADWYYDMQALNKRLTLKVALSLGLTAAQVRTISDSYSMDKLAEEIDLGKTPDSNTQVVKHMQKIFDELIPGAGKVNNHDLAYIMSCFTKRGRQALKVQCSKHAALMVLLLDVGHRIVTNGVYDVDYKIKRELIPAKPVEKTAEAPKAAKKVSKKKKAADPVEELSESVLDEIVDGILEGEEVEVERA